VADPSEGEHAMRLLMRKYLGRCEAVQTSPTCRNEAGVVRSGCGSNGSSSPGCPHRARVPGGNGCQPVHGAHADGWEPGIRAHSLRGTATAERRGRLAPEVHAPHRPHPPRGLVWLRLPVRLRTGTGARSRARCILDHHTPAGDGSLSHDGRTAGGHHVISTSHLIRASRLPSAAH
jgi:hypothetical protein